MLESALNSLRAHAEGFAVDVAADVAVAAHFSASKSSGLRKRGTLFVRDLAIATGIAIAPGLGAPDVVVRPKAPIKTRRFFLAVEMRGRAGEVKVAQVQPQVLFRGKKLVAVDDSPDPGAATYLEGLFVGHKSQIAPYGLGGSISTRSFSPKFTNNEIHLDTCDPALFLTFGIRFLEDCTWYGTVFGEVVQ